MTYGILWAGLLCTLPFVSTAQQIESIAQKGDISFRGAELYKEHCLWVSGTKGTIGKSLDSGKTWTWVTPKGYETFDFRDIEVFSEKEALIVSAGSPAVILRTQDGGISWKEVYRDDRPTAFLDGVDFQNAEGFVIGDPTEEGIFQLLQSKDKGKTWNDVSNFMFLFADDGEAAFAASGTSLKYLHNNLSVGTGGKSANLFRRNEKLLKMDKLPCPILQGEASQGIFSIDFLTDLTGVAVGGDYTKDQENENCILLTNDGGKTWNKPNSNPSGYKSCVKYLNAKTIVATGTSGTDISYNSGRNWQNISKEGFNTIATDESGTQVYLVGDKGRVARIIFPE